MTVFFYVAEGPFRALHLFFFAAGDRSRLRKRADSLAPTSGRNDGVEYLSAIPRPSPFAYLSHCDRSIARLV